MWLFPIQELLEIENDQPSTSASFFKTKEMIHIFMLTVEDNLMLASSRLQWNANFKNILLKTLADNYFPKINTFVGWKILMC